MTDDRSIMPTIPLETAPGAAAPRQAAPAPAMTPFATNIKDPVVGSSIDEVRVEVDEAFADMKTFHNREPDEVFRLVSGHSARLAELRGRIQRIEGMQRQWMAVRTREIEPAIEELMKQYQIASRQLTVRELDWKMETGGR